MYDAAGSISIGALLGVTAIFLISQNRSLLIGGQALHQLPNRRDIAIYSEGL